MLSKKILGIITIILGIALIASSFYIKNQVKAGKKQISEVQGQVNQGSKLFSLNPITKEVGKEISGQVQGKLDEASMKAERYNTIALWFQIGGVILVLLGSGIIVAYRKK